MRVTDLTRQQRVLAQTQRNAGEMQQLQENVASGRRLNRLSDGPRQVSESQTLRERIAFLQNTQGQLEQAYLWLDRTEGELQHAVDLLKQAKQLALDQASAHATRTSRQATAVEVQGLIEGLRLSGNARSDKLYIFGGSRTLTPPLQPNEPRQEVLPRWPSSSGSPSASPLGESDERPLEGVGFSFHGFAPHAYVVRITQAGPLGEARYRLSADGGREFGEEYVLSAENLLNTGPEPTRADPIRLRLRLDEKRAEDLAGPLPFLPEGLELHYRPMPPLRYAGNDAPRELITAEEQRLPINRTAHQVFFETEAIPDSVNVFGVLHQLHDALLADDRHGIEAQLDRLDRAHDQITLNIGILGAARREIEARVDRLAARDLDGTTQIAQLEDLDLSTAVTDLNLSETRHEASLNASARLIQPSLLQFLR